MISEEWTTIPHETFYFEDGNVEIVCGDTVFRVHSTIISFSSSKLRDMLSPSTLLNAPMPEGCPRTVFEDSADDFEVLLETIYTQSMSTQVSVRMQDTSFARPLKLTTEEALEISVRRESGVGLEVERLARVETGRQRVFRRVQGWMEGKIGGLS